jgi:hypothetical protein
MAALPGSTCVSFRSWQNCRTMQGWESAKRQRWLKEGKMYLSWYGMRECWDVWRGGWVWCGAHARQLIERRGRSVVEDASRLTNEAQEGCLCWLAGMECTGG